MFAVLDGISMSYLSLAAAAKAATSQGRYAVRRLDLSSSGDLECRNLMCERLGEACACRLARFVQQTALHALEELDVSGAGLRALPTAVFDSLPALQVLRAARNAIEQVPSEVGLLKDLRILDLSKNRVTKLPVEQLEQLNKLEKIILIENPAAVQIVRSMSTALKEKVVL